MSATADVSRFLQSLPGITERRVNAAREGVDQFGEAVLTRAKELCPVDTGALRRSGTARPAEVHGTVVTKSLGFDTNYAAAVHECGPDKPHHKPPTQWKFLETAMKELDPKFLPYMRDAINGAG